MKIKVLVEERKVPYLIEVDVDEDLADMEEYVLDQAHKQLDPTRYFEKVGIEFYLQVYRGD